MEVWPEIEISRVAQQLENVGGYFLMVTEWGASLVQSVRTRGNSDNFLAVYGPAFPEGVKSPWIIDPPNRTAVIYKTPLELLLSTNPEDWFTQPPSDESACIAIHDGAYFVRVNGDRRPDQYFPCYVDVATGEFFQRLPSYGIYVTKWEVCLKRADGTHHPILAVAGNKICGAGGSHVSKISSKNEAKLLS